LATPEADLSHSAVAVFAIVIRSRTVSAIRAALESAGVEFIQENGGGVGVRLKKPAT